MQWDHLRTFEAVARLGTLSAAAKGLGISQSSVSRHLARLEKLAGTPLCIRDTPVQLTDLGADLLRAMQPMLGGALSARSALDVSGEPRGEVTLATVGEVVRWRLSPQLKNFYCQYPNLRLRLLANNQVHSLAAGEADLAIRAARPDHGDLIARRIFRVGYGYFVARQCEARATTPWLGLAGSLAGIPEQRHAEQVFAQRAPRLLVEDVEALAIAVGAGLGVAVLPRDYALSQGLREVSARAVGARRAALAPRTFWIVVHRARRKLPQVRAVMNWALEAFQQG